MALGGPVLGIDLAADGQVHGGAEAVPQRGADSRAGVDLALHFRALGQAR